MRAARGSAIQKILEHLPTKNYKYSVHGQAYQSAVDIATRKSLVQAPSTLQTWFLVTMITTELSVLLDGTQQALRKLLTA